MALKFLNKKGWHTGSLRNREKLWKAEQNHEVEQKKLEELRKQIQEERERSEFILFQEQAGLVPKQERLDFLYEPELAGAKSSFEWVSSKKIETDNTNSSSSALGALIEVKPQSSSNDAWRKLHCDPLLLIRQREQEALGREKNNPVQMGMFKKNVRAKKHKKNDQEKEYKKLRHELERNNKKKTKHSRLNSEAALNCSEEEKADSLREMQMDAKLHEEQRWKRLKKASEDDAVEGNKAANSLGGRNFLDTALKSVYGAEKGGSNTIEESVRRRKYYLLDRSEGSERNAFWR